jgi:hypothetical protein
MFRGIRETKPGLFLIVAISLTSLAAVAQPASWQQYVVPESGAVAQIPTDIFSEDGGKPESGYGRRFFTSDRNANLTVQSIPNDANDTPAVFLAKKHPPSDIAYKRVTSRFLLRPAIGKTRSGTIAVILWPIS